MAFSAGDIEAHLTVNRDDFNKGLDQAKADADKFAKNPVQVKITADGTAAKTTLDDLSARKDKLGKDASFKVAADGSGARTELDAVQAKKDKAGQDVSFKVRAETAEAAADLAKVQAEKDKAGTDTSFKVKAEVDTSGLDEARKKITELASGPFGLLKTAIVGLGPAAVPVAGAVIAAFAPLAPAIGSAAVGLEAFGQLAKAVLTPAAAAATAVYKAQNTYNAAIASGTKQATAYKAEQLAISKAYAGMSVQQIALSKQVGDLQAGWRDTLKSVTPLVSSALVPWMKDIRQLLQYIKPLIAPIATDFQAWGTELGKFLSANQSKLRDFFGVFGARSAGNIASLGDALISFAKGAGALIHDIAPELGGAANGIAGLAASFAKWAGSKQAADDIKGFFTWAKAETPLVRQFLDSLTGSVGNLIKALAYSGGGDLRVLTTALQALSALPPGAIVALADAYVAVSLGLRAASAGMAAWNVVSTIAKGIQAALSDEIKVTGAALVVQKIALLAMAAADAVVDAAETIYIALMIVADAVSAPLILVIGAIVLAAAALALGIYELVTHWTTVWHAILAVTQVVWNWIKGNWPLLVGILLGPIAIAAALILTHWNTIKNDAIAVWNAIKSFFTGWWNGEVADFRSAVNTVKSVLTSGWNAITSAVKSAWNAIRSWFSSWWDASTALFRSALNTVKSVLSAAWNAITSAVKSAWNAIRSWFSSWWSANTALVRGALNTVKSVLSSGWNSIYSTVRSVFGKIHTFFSSFWAALKSGFNSAVNGVKTAWTKLETVVKTPVQWVVTNVYDKLIVPFWNATGAKVGLGSLKKLASGGMVPGGYSPVDNQLAWVRSGEGVLQPGAVSALGGPGFIHWANRTYGDVPVSDGAPGHFAAGGVAGQPSGGGGGGLLSDIGGVFTSVWDKGLHLGANVLKALAAVTDVRQFLKLPLEAVEKAIDGVIGEAPGKGGMATYIKDAATKIVNAAFSNVISATTPGGTGKYTGSYGTGVAQWKSDVLRVLSMLGLPSSDAGLVLYQMQTESSGRPNAINNYDINAQNGDPSRGLMQTIMTTFEAWRSPSLPNDIYDPMANIYAAVNYAEHTPGVGIGPSPGQLGGGSGYDSGGWLQPGATMVFNTSGRPEPVLSAGQWDTLSSAMAGSELGGKLDRIANLLASGPRATGASVGEVVNGSAHNASFRSRYPRNR